jgi:flagellar biosynthetic protein FliP
VALLGTLTILVLARATSAADEPASRTARALNPGGRLDAAGINRPLEEPEPPATSLLRMAPERDLWKTVETVALFGLISLAPMGLLMVTALALSLTALVMWPLGEKVYRDAVVPYRAGRLELAGAWAAGSQPIKTFMIDQIKKTNHEDYLQALQEYAIPPSPGHGEPAPARVEDYSLRIVAPAYLLSELTTALMIGFFVYLPFLVIDLVVSSVLAATGLFMLPPALVASPIKLIVFVLADGWILIATMLLSTFQAASGGP